MIRPEVFEQVNAELVRMRQTDAVRLFAICFDDESGNLDNVHLNGGIHELAERNGVEVTLKSVAGYEQYQCRIGNVLYSQSVPKRQDDE